MLLRFLLIWMVAWHAGMAHAGIIVLLSDDKPSMLGVAQAIQNVPGVKTETVNLHGDRNTVAGKIAAVQASSYQRVVAVGLLAAQVARQHLSSKHVVFCQVLNYEEFDLTTSWMKGVSALPSMQKQLQVWKALNPALQRVGVISSRQMRGEIEDATAQARQFNIELLHLEVSSDREVMLALKRAGPIQGLWIAPDSRILSTSVILDMVSYASRQNIQVLGFSPALLREGALLSGTPDYNEIGRLAVTRLRQAQGMQVIPGEPVTPLTSANITINGGLAARLGLTITDRVKAMAHVE